LSLSVSYTGSINGVPIDLRQGCIAEQESDACIVPQCRDGLSTDATVRNLLEFGVRESAMASYETYVKRKGGRVELGDAYITTSTGGRAKFLIHIASVGVGHTMEILAVQKSIYNALLLAEKQRLKDVVLPMCGTTPLFGTLMKAESAKAMMSAVQQFAKDGGRICKVTFVVPHCSVFEDNPLNIFEQILNDGSYDKFLAGGVDSGRVSVDFPTWAAQRRKEFVGQSIIANEVMQKDKRSRSRSKDRSSFASTDKQTIRDKLIGPHLI
jgi:O-acetyl-ADP-ribose deacetylase (regulator of RNase III)